MTDTPFPDAWIALDALYRADTETNEPVPELDMVNNVYFGEPGAGRGVGPIFVTTVPETFAPDNCAFKTRVYVDLDTDAQSRQLEWAYAVNAVDNLLTAEWPRGSWEFGYDPSIDRLVAQMVTGINRP